jgi:O-methyltransferase involved in polyketide biosynthesis
MRRAAHQLFDNPKVLDDPIAVSILGEKAQAQICLEERSSHRRASRYVRAFMVVRSRFAEDTLAHAIGRGASQFVILGAGLDTFAYRNPYDENRLRVFEVDHPATQKWKRERLVAAPRASFSWFRRFAFGAMARRVAKAGEPFQLFFDPAKLANELRRLEFNKVEDLGADELNKRTFKDRADKLRWGGGMGRLISAVV